MGEKLLRPVLTFSSVQFPASFLYIRALTRDPLRDLWVVGS